MESFTWFDELLANIHGQIERGGWSLMSVMGDKNHFPWCYTIGLVETFDHPELIMIGLDDRSSAMPLNSLSESVATGARLAAGDILIVEGIPVAIGTVHPAHWESEWFAKWHHYYECVGAPISSGSALQVIWPDDVTTCFPGEDGWNPAHDKCQPLLSYP